MITNSNELREILRLRNPYFNLGKHGLSRRRFILFEEMCVNIKPYSTIKQFKTEIKLANLAAKHPDFYSLCPVIFEFDFNCAVKNVLQLLKEIQTTERAYDPVFNKKVFKSKRPPKPEVTELPVGFKVRRIERRAA